ncbi:hypothetical protein IU403_05310 [Aerococcaceae bacterium zg-BR22]|uniref:hypothetical protein n=1 Tax=Aerococcaceae bacterium zg-1292 TaxID=2774330 RepID=UPI004062E2B5|nr:hypothetical protein [Aerococcaceae bacterium zg-BR22]
MKKLFLLLSLFALPGCVSEPTTNEEQSSQAVESTVKKVDGEEYVSLTNNLWLIKSYSLNETQTIPIYNTKSHEDVFYNNQVKQLESANIKAEYSNHVADRRQEKIMSFDNTKISTAYSTKRHSLAVLFTTPQGDVADSIFNIFTNLVQKNSIDTKLDSEVDTRSIEVVKEYMKLFELPYEYDYVATSISTDKFKEIQTIAKRVYEPGDFPEEVLNSAPVKFDAVTLVPILNNVPLTNHETSIGTTQQLNGFIGTGIKFIVIDGKIAYSYISNLFHPTKSEETVKLNNNKVVEAIKKRYSGLDIKEDIYIDSIVTKYIPIANQDADETYKDYKLQPIVEVLAHHGDNHERFYISPVTYTEVR